MNTDEQATRSTAFEARGRVLQCIRSEARRCANEGTLLAVIAIDFDHLDTLVTSAGEDAAEETFGKLLRAVQIHCGRERDAVFRVASDRIIAVCPKTPPAGAQHVASQICEAAGGLCPQANGSPVTLSVGIAISAPGSEEAADGLLASAEHSVEAARDKGGNRILGAAPAAPATVPVSLRAFLASALRTKPVATGRRQGD